MLNSWQPNRSSLKGNEAKLDLSSCRRSCLCFGLSGHQQCSADTGADTWKIKLFTTCLQVANTCRANADTLPRQRAQKHLYTGDELCTKSIEQLGSQTDHVWRQNKPDWSYQTQTFWSARFLVHLPSLRESEYVKIKPWKSKLIHWGWCDRLLFLLLSLRCFLSTTLAKKKNHPRDSRWEERCSTCDIVLDQARSAQGKSRGQSRIGLACADRAWSSMISHVEQRSSRRESRWWFFFLARVVC